MTISDEGLIRIGEEISDETILIMRDTLACLDAPVPSAYATRCALVEALCDRQARTELMDAAFVTTGLEGLQELEKMLARRS